MASRWLRGTDMQTMKRHRPAGRNRQSSRGFSVVEALVAAAILGIALIGIVRIHGSSIRGTAKAERVGRASVVARQFAELYATTSPQDLPACPPGPNAAPLGPSDGCKSTTPTVPNPPKGTGCTLWVNDGPSIPSINDVNAQNGEIVALNSPGALGQQPSQYRIDVSVSRHPDLNFQNAALLTVWVCWRDELGTINEVRTRRLLF